MLMPNSESLTMVDKAIGTVYYISPEQASSRKIDARSDIYSLGVMLYEMVTGQMPFTADMPIAVIMKHMNSQPVPPTKVVPSIPRGLEQIILCAMEKQPKNRYQSASQMLRHLRRLKMDENTVFNIPKPAHRTPTSETILKKTARHGSDSSAEEKKPPVTPETPQKPKQPQGSATPPGAKTKRLTEPVIPAEKKKITPEPLPPQRPSKSAHTQGGAQKPAGGTRPQGAQNTGAKPRPQPAPQKPKQKKQGISSTAMLIIIIICLLIAIIGTLALFMGSGSSAESAAFVCLPKSPHEILLYLKQVVL